MVMIEESEDQDEVKEKHHFMSGEKTCSQLKKPKKPHCAKTFTLKGNFKKQVRIHSGEKTLHMLSVWKELCV